MDFLKTYGNPAHPAYLADPFVFKHEGVFFAIGTGEPNLKHGSGRVFPTLRSEDFVVWESMPPALVPPDAALGTDFWAPEIVHVEGKFYLYYSVGFGDKNHQLRVAISNAPLGPYTDVGEPVLDPSSCAFAIDANPFRDRNGDWYLFYSRDLLDTDRPGTSLVMSPLHDMTRISSDYLVVGRATHDWQRYQKDRPLYGGVFDWHTLEGPCVVEHQGRYYCIYSGGNWTNESYGLDYFVADNVAGPYVEEGSSEAARILKTVPNRVIGPGHNSIVIGPNGLTEYVAYHAWDAKKVARRLCFDALDWTPQGPRCLGPSWEPKVVDW